MNTVELHNAFVWTCDECGRDNFCRGITVAPESIEAGDMPLPPDTNLEEIQEWLDAGGGGHWMTAPETVTCSHCGETFGVEEPETSK